ncbi:unnamed protein product [Acanthoscelides obtectus]|uniref:Nucleic-acid-binding protein from mobile element jockey n=1 Tax=Acanthoscelides obtectus TaxID=200917 RepID=A0A9P0LU35_ACAOB|nr:unnamed protein product [Acanthoscelides obtectus]CAK1680285.1 hypothetical protein AOBTE_LOCUS32560 [Acanthoscelides obtectus]
MLKAGNVFIGLDCCRYFDAVQVSRCFNCNGFNHSSKLCKKERSCPRCGENHAVKDCKSATLKSINCVFRRSKGELNVCTNHAAWDIKNCSSYLQACSKLRADLLKTVACCEAMKLFHVSVEVNSQLYMKSCLSE